MGAGEAHNQETGKKPRKQKAKLCGGKGSRLGKQKLNAKEIEFCTKRAFGDTLREVSAAMGMPLGTCFTWSQRDEIRNYIAELTEKIGKEAIRREFKARILSRDILDEHVVKVFRKAKKPSFVLANYLKTGYDTLGLIPKTSVNVSSSAQAAALQPQQAGTNFANVYEAKWLREKKAKWDEALEERFAEPTVNALPAAPDEQS